MWRLWAWLNEFLSHLGVPTPRTRLYDTALAITASIKANAKAHLAKPRDEDRYLLYAQIAGLQKFIVRHRLINDGDIGSKSDLTLIGIGTFTGQDDNDILPALNRLTGLLEVHRAILTGRAIASTAAPAYGNGRATSPSRPAPSPPPPDQPIPDHRTPDQPNELALLWNASEKLSGSWPFKLLGALLLSAVLLAGAGTFFIGGQALKLREDLYATGGRETSSLEQLAKNTRETVSQQSQMLLGNLDRQQTEINVKMASAEKKISDLDARADQIRKEAVDRVVTDIRRDMVSVEKALRDDLEASLNKIKTQDVQDLKEKVQALQGQVLALGKQVGEGQSSVSASATTIKTLLETATRAENLKVQADGIETARKSVEESLRKTGDYERQAANAESQVRQTLATVADQLRSQTGRIADNERELGTNQGSLRKLSDEIRKVDLEAADIRSMLEGARRARDMMQQVDGNLARLKAEADALDRRIKEIDKTPPPPPTGVPVPQRTETSLTREDWRAIQTALKMRGFYTGKLDGKVGRATRGAIGKYQAARHVNDNTLLTPEQIGDLLGPVQTSGK